MRTLLFLFFACCLSTASQARETLLHLATASNTAEDVTILESPFLNGNQNAVLLVIPVIRGGTGTPPAVGVGYDTALGKWRLRTRDGSPMPQGVRFHVLGVRPEEGGLVHRAEMSNTEGSVTWLPLTDRNAVPLVSYSFLGGYNPFPVAVRFDQARGRWGIENRGGANMGFGTVFHVWAAPGSSVQAGNPIPTLPEQLVLITALSGTGPAGEGLRLETTQDDGAYTVAFPSGVSPGPADRFHVVSLSPERDALASASTLTAVSNLPPAQLRLGTVTVLDRRGTPAAGAEVYLGERSIGPTDARGQVRLPAEAASMPADTVLVARKLVETREGYRRPNKPAYRVYQSSYDATQPSVHTLGRPDRDRQLHLGQTVIGVHLEMSAEWDATPAELEALREQFRLMSQGLYHASDSQFYLERVDLSDDGRTWDLADMRMWANRDGRANVLPRLWGLVNPHPWSYLNVVRGHDFRTWVHEFGHYGWCLLDEYHEHNQAAPTCTEEGGTEIDPPTPFSAYQVKSACLMAHHQKSYKLCSSYMENRHVGGLRQGNPCWTQLKACFPYGLFEPRDRHQVPGLLTAPYPFVPFIRDVNFERGPVSNRFVLPLEHRDGRPAQNVGVWLRSGGKTIFEGYTGHREPWGMTEAAGQLTMTGVHAGDVVEWSTGSSRVTAEEVAGGGSSPIAARDASLLLAARGKALIYDPPAAFLGVALDPDGSVRVRSDVPLAEAPRLSMVPCGDGKPAETATDPEGEGWVASLPLPKSGDPVVLEVQARTAEGATLRTLQQAARYEVTSEPTVEGQAASADGRVFLEVPKGWVGQVAVTAGGTVPPPASPVLSGPYELAGPKELRGTLRFRLLEPPDGRGDNPSLLALRYEPVTDSWRELPGRYLPDLYQYLVPADGPGSYVLVWLDGEQVTVPPAPVAAPPTESAAPVAEPPAESPPPEVVPPAEPKVPAGWVRLAGVEVHPGGRALLTGESDMPYGGHLVLLVMDLEGRIVLSSGPLPVPPGVAQVQWWAEGLAPGGSYLVRAASTGGLDSEPAMITLPGEVGPKEEEPSQEWPEK